MMADATLHGNGTACPACALRREARDPWDAAPVPCNVCGGTGRHAFTDREIVAAHVAEARRSYWPARLARWGLA